LTLREQPIGCKYTEYATMYTTKYMKYIVNYIKDINQLLVLSVLKI